METEVEGAKQQDPVGLTLTLVTLKGEQKVESVPQDATVDQLRDLFHEASEASGLECPCPEKQRVVYQGKEIRDCTLEQAGISDGCSVVVVERRDLVTRCSPVVDKSPAKEWIQEMTTKLAEQKGNIVSRSGVMGTGGHDRSTAASINDIQQLLNAITTDTDRTDGSIRSNALRHDPITLWGLGSGERGESEGSTGEEDNLEEVEGDGLLSAELESTGDEQVQLPEADPTKLSRLMEMGFSETLARKALILRHNNLDAAMDWVFEHQDDPDAETPLTEAQLRRIAVSRRRHRRHRRRFRRSWPRSDVAVDQDLVTQLGEMGFSESLSRFALGTFNNNMELACQWLLASADDFESDPELDNSPRQNEGSDEDDDGAQQGGVETETSASQIVQDLQDLGLRLRGHALPDSGLRLRGLGSSPSLQQERLMHAFQAMIENPREARSYLTDPEIGPILLQVQRAQRVSSGITPMSQSNAAESTDSPGQEDSPGGSEG
ncbi:hypothetical protein HOP50_05g37470 [Chloropicon primus]|uniref:Uncharacterized protein n=2 Tax=Chloropicon primus TaxID=1764295 RepID=A0A5B8MLC8_9CHLO|nr:hypothetical protein A3770_05p37370 [Chloropicon primus]UPR00433.1 hypothetical protein HOP50_05g37470 [Chloropicon primus]|eukprot:QDZ21219.1 hypothetical protein A3770_05p37370 [Chloropicon primus]